MIKGICKIFMTGGFKMKIKDGLILMYVKDGKVYPVALSDEKRDLLQHIGKVFEPITVIDESMGEAIYMNDKNCEVEK